MPSYIERGGLTIILAEKRLEFGWLWPLSRVSHSLDYCKLRHACFVSRAVYNYGELFTPKGVRLDAYLWDIDSWVDFFWIQEEWAKTWNSLKTVKVIVSRTSDETDEQLLERQRVVMQRLSTSSDLQQQIKHGNINHRSDLRPGLEFELEGPRIGGDPAKKRLVARIIFDILRDLYLNPDASGLSIGLANSIWHSFRIDAVKSDEVLPDYVDDWLFHDPAIENDPASLLQLDDTRDGSFGQAWLIERIMRDGYVYIGQRRDMLQQKKAPLPSDTKLKDAGDGETSVKERQELTTSTGDSLTSNTTEYPLERETILDLQMRHKILASRAAIGQFERYNTDGKHADWDPRNMASLIMAGAALRDRRKEGLHENKLRVEDCVAIFDVDAPCVVAIPYQGDLERLPRPSLRSMSVCWVVEPVILKKELGTGSSEKNGPDVSAVDSGSSKEDSPIQEDSAEASEAERLEGQAPPEGEDDEHEPLYKVVNKVRGLWTITLGSPYKKFLFT